MMQTKRMGWMAAVLVATATLVPGQAHAASAEADEFYREGATLTDTVAGIAWEIQRHARHLERVSNQTNVSRESHADHLDAIRVLVNGPLRKALFQLDAVKSSLPEWKQDTIPRMTPSAQSLAASASAAYSAKWADTRLPVAMSDAYRSSVEQLGAQAENLTHISEASSARAQFLLRTANWERSSTQTNQ